MNRYAIEHDVPIVRSSEINILQKMARGKRRVLEIGTAIGYSALLLAEVLAEGGQVTSVELSSERVALARAYIARSPYQKNITVIQQDANEFLEQQNDKYDFVFLDGPKGQYLKQLKLCLPFLEDQAIVAADNVTFRGYVLDGVPTPRRFRTITKRLREYLRFVEEAPCFSTQLYREGDGLAISCFDKNKGF